jgi:peptidoglycan/LPS O-acetylase OafA/YrhL
MEKLDFQYTYKKIFQFDVYRGVLLYLIFIVHHQFDKANIPALLAYYVLHGFFIMSAFLISRGLLIAKENNISKKDYYKTFYIKRILRIFPVYFLYVFGIISVGLISKIMIGQDMLGVLREIKKFGALLFTFTYNYKDLILFLKNIDTPEFILFSHLWSLSIEEQFYLIIPTIILFFNRKQLVYISVFFIIFSPIFRIWYFNNVLDSATNLLQKGLVYYRSSFLQLDAFFYGILLATYNFKNRLKLYKIISIVLWLVFIITIIYNAYDISNKYNRPLNYSLFGFDIAVMNNQYIYNDTLINLIAFFGFLISLFDEKYLSFFNKKIIVDFGGKYSYSAYVYQYLFILPFRAILYPVLQKYLNIPDFILQVFVILLSITCIYLLSMLSFWKMEIKFLNLLKNKK